MKLLSVVAPASAVMQADTTSHAHEMHMHDEGQAHTMTSFELGGGWRLSGMVQLFPMATFGLAEGGSLLDDQGF